MNALVYRRLAFPTARNPDWQIPKLRATVAAGRDSMSVYDHKPDRFLAKISAPTLGPNAEIYCAGFELEEWRGKQFAFHLVEWLPEYALPEDELRMHHGNLLVKLNQAAVRVYTSEKYKKRGEVGEIALHAICRDYFGTIPLSPRVFYKSASNDVIKAFDMIHVRLIPDTKPEIWLGESKLYEDPADAIGDAIASVKAHLDAGFLENQKVLLGPQIPKSTPRYDEIMAIFRKSASLDDLIASAVFVIGISCTSAGAMNAKLADEPYLENVRKELDYLVSRVQKSGLADKVKVVILYTPLANKAALVDAFDVRLKGLQ
jgi:GNAT superfamily N-acetyltransferase